MLCEKCGGKNPDGARVCAECGATLSPKAQAPGESSVAELLSRDGRGRKGLVVIGAAVAAAVVVLIVAVAVLLGGKPAYIKPLDRLMDVYSNGDADAETLASMLPPAVMKEIEDRHSDHEDMLESLEDGMKFAREYLKDELGTNLKAEYEIRRDRKLSQKKLTELEERYHDLFDVDLDIKEARELKYRVTFSGKEDETSGTSTLVVIKVDGKWYWDFTTLSF